MCTLPRCEPADGELMNMQHDDAVTGVVRKLAGHLDRPGDVALRRMARYVHGEDDGLAHDPSLTNPRAPHGGTAEVERSGESRGLLGTKVRRLASPRGSPHARTHGVSQPLAWRDGRRTIKWSGEGHAAGGPWNPPRPGRCCRSC